MRTPGTEEYGNDRCSTEDKDSSQQECVEQDGATLKTVMNMYKCEVGANSGLESEEGRIPKDIKLNSTGKIALTLLLSLIAALIVVLISRAVWPKPTKYNSASANKSESVTHETYMPTVTAVPCQFAYITNVESGALVFSEARRSSDVITKISKGERVEIVERLPDGEWCRVHYMGIYAYIQLKYLALE